MQIRLESEKTAANPGKACDSQDDCKVQKKARKRLAGKKLGTKKKKKLEGETQAKSKTKKVHIYTTLQVSIAKEVVES